MGAVRRPTAPSAAAAAVVAGATLFVVLQLRPDLLVSATTPSGGDMGAQVWGPAFLRDRLLPHGRLTGWAPDWFAGFPFPTFYFPLPLLAVVAVDLVAPYGVALKLVAVSGLVGLPAAAWAFGRLSGLRDPGPACLAVAATVFLFDRTWTIHGGNVASALAGEYAYSVALALALVFLGALARALRTGRGRALAAGLLALTVLSHPVPALLAVAGAVVTALAGRGRAARVRRATAVVAAGGLMPAFWALPLVARLPLANDMGYEKVVRYRSHLAPQHLRWLVALAGLGALAAAVARSRPGAVLAALAGLSAAAFRLAPQGLVWNPRFLPLWFLCLYLLAGVAVASVAWAAAGLARREGAGAAAAALERTAAAGVPLAAAVVALVAVGLPLRLPLLDRLPLPATGRSFVPDWVEWNFSGYEAKASHHEYRAVVAAMDRVGRTVGCGRAHWEHEPALDRLGTPLALMLLPYWTGGCIGTTEGLYAESSATAPFAFMASSELSSRATRPQRGLPYRDADLAVAVGHLRVLGTRYLLVSSDAARAAAAAHPGLRPVAAAGPFSFRHGGESGRRRWEVYEVAGWAPVVALGTEPAVVAGLGRGGRAWRQASARWFQEPHRWGVPLAAAGPPGWRRLGAGGAGRAPPAPVPVRPARVSGVRTGDDRIAFRVDRPGTPVLVRTSYFPNWRATGAAGPWRVTPNFMVVVPTAGEVELRYRATAVERAGWALTGLGLLLTAALAARRPALPTDTGRGPRR